MIRGAMPPSGNLYREVNEMKCVFCNAACARGLLGELVRFDVELDGGFGLAVLVLDGELVVARVLGRQTADLEYERVRLALDDMPVSG